MNLLKKLFYVLILLITVCVLAIAALMFFIDPNQLKPVITKEVMKRTGYKLVVDGKLSWSFYPLVGIKAHHMQLYHPGDKTPLVDLKGVSIATDVWQLLRGKQQLSGDVYIENSILEKIHTEGIHVGIAWHNDILSLSPISVKLYQGTLLGDFSASHLAKVPSWRWQINLNNVDLKSLLKDLKNEDNHFNIKGKAEFKMQASAKGMDEAAVVDSMAGRAQFAVHQGALEGVDLDYFIDSAQALINKKPLPMPSGGNETRFDNLSGSAVIDSGVAKTDDLLLISKALITRGQGSVNLAKSTLDYQLTVTPVSSGDFKWQVPVLVSGELNAPRVQLDVTALNTMIVKEQVKKIGEKVQDEVKKQIKNLPETTSQFIKNLTGE